MTLVRRAAPGDAAAVSALVEAAYAPYVPVIGRRPAPMDQDYPRILGGSHCWVAELDAQLVGVLVTDPQPDHLLLENVAVHPFAQRHGVGARLLQVAEAYAAELGLSQVRLYTNEAMTANLWFYPRHGYSEVGRGEQDGFRRVFFVKQLRP